MITQNNKLYQYASSNMNTILIRYTEFKDPDESKTNADILEVREFSVIFMFSKWCLVLFEGYYKEREEWAG